MVHKKVVFIVLGQMHFVQRRWFSDILGRTESGCLGGSQLPLGFQQPPWCGSNKTNTLRSSQNKNGRDKPVSDLTQIKDWPILKMNLTSGVW